VERLFANRRAVFGSIAVLTIGMLGFGLYLQHVKGLEPCPLCVLQRYAFVLIALFALLAAFSPRPGKLGALFGGLTVLSAAAGTAIATWHTWLQLNPPPSYSCGANFDYLISSLPLTESLPKIFRGSGDCTAIDWSFLGLSIPNWSLAWFLVFLVVGVMALRRRAG
jgi:disulfide bond formation protein DsbB